MNPPERRIPLINKQHKAAKKEKKKKRKERGNSKDKKAIQSAIKMILPIKGTNRVEIYQDPLVRID